MNNYLNTTLNSSSVVLWDTGAHTVPVDVTAYNWEKVLKSAEPLFVWIAPKWHGSYCNPCNCNVPLHFCHREMVKNCPSQSMQRKRWINCNHLSDPSWHRDYRVVTLACVKLHSLAFQPAMWSQSHPHTVKARRQFNVKIDLVPRHWKSSYQEWRTKSRFSNSSALN